VTPIKTPLSAVIITLRLVKVTSPHLGVAQPVGHRIAGSSEADRGRLAHPSGLPERGGERSVGDGVQMGVFDLEQLGRHSPSHAVQPIVELARQGLASGFEQVAMVTP
jgi:hypothetical protein